jgi:glucose/mannose-6-phosphate isomerase
MIDLDTVGKFGAVDQQGMLDHALDLPRTCSDAWELAQKRIPQLGFSRAAFGAVKRIVITGMGGSAIGGDLLASLIAHECTCPILVHRNYGLPAYVDGSETLVIGSSHSGGTEETLSAFQAAHERETLLLALTTGGELARLAGEWDVPVLKFGYEAQPRAALGYSFVLLVSLLDYLGFISGKATDLTEAVNVMREWQQEIGPDVPLAQNPAKQLADRLMNRIPVIYGSGITEPVARRWKTQFNENAKSWAFYEPLPELNHNAVVGYERSDLVRDRAWVVALQSRYDSERIKTRWDVTRQMLSNAGVDNAAVQARGTSRLAQMLSLIHFGDLVSVYHAIASGVDPTPVGPIVHLKRELAKS